MPSASSRPVTVVSGFPRSGTSLLMQMLAASGCSILSDASRTPDESNPRGYFELEAVKRIARDKSWLEGARGKVVKIVTPLLSNLPRGETYRVLMVHRDWSEVIASQTKMRRLVEPSFQINSRMVKALIETFEKQEKRALIYLKDTLEARMLDLDHRDLIEAPVTAAGVVGRFLEYEIDPQEFASAVRPNLYRNRSEGT